MSATKLKFGIYGHALQELDNLRFEGVLKFCVERKIDLCDLRRLTMIPDIHLATPPWRGKVDGLVICTGRELGHPESIIADWIVAGGVPAVSISADWVDPRVPLVYVDHQKLAKLASDYLLALGCKSFLFFGFDESTGSHRRGEEFARLLAQQNQRAIQYHNRAIHQGGHEDHEELGGNRELAKLLRAAAKPLGIWALNDSFGASISQTCKALGFEIPSQVRILATNDTSLARNQMPSLSSIQTSSVEIGYRAAQLVKDLLDGKRVKKITAVSKLKLVERDSTRVVESEAGEIEDVWRYIQDHACQGITIEQLLQIVKCSRRTLQSRFSEKYGHGPYEEIQRVRLERAASLLRETQLSISRIAAMVGFEEVGSFGKFFRNQTQRSPKEFREDAT